MLVKSKGEQNYKNYFFRIRVYLWPLFLIFHLCVYIKKMIAKQDWSQKNIFNFFLYIQFLIHGDCKSAFLIFISFYFIYNFLGFFFNFLRCKNNRKHRNKYKINKIFIANRFYNWYFTHSKIFYVFFFVHLDHFCCKPILCNIYITKHALKKWNFV